MTAIAIDGPAGAGKSTIAERIAEELGYLYIDTGALYRAIGLFMLENGADAADPKQVCPLLKKISVSLEYQNKNLKVILNGNDVSSKIRSEEVSTASSKVSAIPEVRKFLIDVQRNLAEKDNVVMDGRDIGTVVLPNAQVKIFLTASPEDRARRRFEEMIQKGIKSDYNDVLNDMKQRDYRDIHRAISPLKAAEDAIKIDTTDNTFEQSVKLVIQIIRRSLSKKSSGNGMS